MKGKEVKGFVITKTPDEGYMMGQKMYFVGIEGQETKSVAKHTVSYNANKEKAMLFYMRMDAAKMLRRILESMGDREELYGIEKVGGGG